MGICSTILHDMLVNHSSRFNGRRGYLLKPKVTVYDSATTTTHDFEADTRFARVMVVGGGDSGQAYTSSNWWTHYTRTTGGGVLKAFNMEDADVGGDTQANLVVGGPSSSSTFALGSISIVAYGGNGGPGSTPATPTGGDLNMAGSFGEWYNRLDGTGGSAASDYNRGASFPAPGCWGRNGANGVSSGNGGNPSTADSGVIVIEEYK